MSDRYAWKRFRDGYVKSYGYGYDANVRAFPPSNGNASPPPVPSYTIAANRWCWQFSLGTEQCGEEYDTPEEAMGACDEQALSTARGIVERSAGK